MRVLIGGEDELAVSLAEVLMQDHDVTVLAPSSMRGSSLDRLDVEVRWGSCSSSTALQSANVDQAEFFIACTPADERNLVAAAAAKRLGAKQAICFLRRHEVQANEREAERLALSLGIDQVILPAERLAREILRIVMVPGALDVVAFEGGRVRLVRKEIPEGSHLTTGTLREIGVPQGVVLVTCRRDEELFIPKGDTRFRPGDQVTAMGDQKGINKFMTRFLGDRQRRDLRRATVVGGGVVGLTVAKGLESAGWTVKVVESNERRANEIAQQLKSMVLHGDGTDLELLAEEHIGEDPVLIAVTSRDEVNLLVSLLAKQEGVPRIITRADRMTNERLFEKVGIDVVRSAQGAAIHSVLRKISRSRDEPIAELEHGDLKVLRLPVREDFPPTPLAQMRAPVFAIVGAVSRGGNVLIPQGDTVIEAGDTLLTICTAEDEEEARNFFSNFSGASAD
ncbi:MAG: Trk system potassium transporter TrkA [Planctomycetes bacterium]|nr:Trk system potassium transporter TrkA [Planctomycetota bacterium]